MPFAPKHAMTINRRRELVALAEPLKRSPVGFAAVPSPGTPEGKDHVVHTCPWTPVMDDWSRLLDVLVSLMDPVTIIVRLQPDSEEDSAREVDRVMQIVRTCESYLAAKHERTVPAVQVQTIRDVALTRAIGLRNGAFRLGVFLVSSHPVNASVGHVVRMLHRRRAGSAEPVLRGLYREGDRSGRCAPGGLLFGTGTRSPATR